MMQCKDVKLKNKELIIFSFSLIATMVIAILYGALGLGEIIIATSIGTLLGMATFRYVLIKDTKVCDNRVYSNVIDGDYQENQYENRDNNIIDDINKNNNNNMQSTVKYEYNNLDINDIHPKEISHFLKGITGFILDVHTISSTPIGSGQFIIEYSKMGEMMHGLKYSNKREYIQKIGEIAAGFIDCKYMQIMSDECPYPHLDGIICTPPSKLDRSFQPVDEIAKEISKYTNIPIFDVHLVKNKKTQTLKNLSEKERIEELKDALSAKYF